MTIEIVFPEPAGDITDAEIEAIRNHPSAQGAERAFVSLAPDGSLDVAYVHPARRFDRIRRITGYLTGTLDTWNDAKRAEERDRTKHGLPAANREPQTANCELETP